jgi:hypothetical protein
MAGGVALRAGQWRTLARSVMGSAVRAASHFWRSMQPDRSFPVRPRTCRASPSMQQEPPASCLQWQERW